MAQVKSTGLTNRIGYPAGHVIKWGKSYLTTDIAATGTSWNNFWSPVYSPDGGAADNTTIFAYFYFVGSTYFGTGIDGRGKFRYDISGDDVTNSGNRPGDSGGSYFSGGYINNSTGVYIYTQAMMALGAVTLDGTGHADLTWTLSVKHNEGAGHVDLEGNNTDGETWIQFFEVQA